jgi:hypothetical protein
LCELKLALFPCFLSVVFVVRNQSDNLEKILSDATAVIADIVGDYELIVVDNASDDDSIVVLKRLTYPLGLRLEQLLADYAASFRQGLLICSLAPGLHVLREVFAQREFATLFHGGLFGSPDAKDQILSRECGNNNIVQPALFIGESKYDY